MAMSRTWSSGVAHSVGFARNSAGFLRTEDARVSRVGRAQTSESRTYEREGNLGTLVEIALSGEDTRSMWAVCISEGEPR
jgi:hypothetical protein